MKKLMSVILALLLTVALASCGDKNMTSSSTEQEPPAQSVVPEKEWTEQAIRTLFQENKESNETLIDCVVVDDQAYNRVGVVLYEVDEEDIIRVAFMRPEGALTSHCSIHAQVIDDAILTYCGDGVVTLQAQAEDDILYEYKISYTVSEDKRNVTFDLEAVPLP